MANEIRGISTSGTTVYSRIMNSAGLWWTGSAFESYSAANWANYVATMTEQGSSGVFVADFPSGITSGGTYDYFVHIQAGGSPAQGDQVASTGRIDWTGTSIVTATSGAMTASDFYAYVLRRGFKRTDKATEFYEATTDAVQEMRRRFAFDEAETESTSTDVLDVAGEFQIAIESDMGLLLGVIVEDDDTGTPLNRITKMEYDSRYSGVHTTGDYTGYPKDYCVFGGQIYIGPVPDRTTYVFRLSYSQRAGTVTSSTSGVPFTDLYRDVLSDLVQHYLYDGLDEDAKADKYRGRFENGFIRAIRRERANSGEGNFNMMPTNC